MKKQPLHWLCLLIIFCHNYAYAQPEQNNGELNTEENTYIPTSTEIDQHNVVGEIPLNSGSTPSGAKTYQVPIETAPGINGFQPNLSLSYNSMQSYSPVGVGWRLDGIPQISRMGKNIYYHGKTEGINLDNTDTFVLDGITLIKTEDRSTTGYFIYESVQGNIKIKGYIKGEIMQYFEVYYPDGNKGIFGYPNSTENNLYYPITSITDLHGNIITYDYIYSGNDYYINKIQYNGASIEFSYNTDNFNTPTYCAGKKIEHTKILYQIRCKNESGTLGTYTLKQTNYTGLAQLKQIDYTKENKKLNPIKFEYGDGDLFGSYSSKTTILTKYFPYDQPSNIKAIRGKFDNLNKSDGVIAQLYRNPYIKHYKKGGLFNHTENYFTNQYGENEDIFVYTDIGDSFVSPIPQLTTGTGFVDILCADIEGKQEERIIKINNYVSNNTDKIDFHIYKYTLTKGFTEYLTRTFSFNTVFTDNGKNQSIQPKYYYAGDFNGDGKLEILAVSVDNPFGEIERPSKCYIFNLETGETLYESQLFTFKAEFPEAGVSYPIGTKLTQDLIYVIDYDGDGKSDICHINESGLSVYTFTTTNTGLIGKQTHSGNELNLSKLDKRDLIPGDLNGDGLTDLALSPEKTMYSPSQWEIYYSMGDGQFNKETCKGAGVNGAMATRFHLLDINGDGKSDLIRCDKLNIETYLMTDQGFLLKGTIENPSESIIVIPVANTSRNTFPSLLLLNNSEIIQYSYSRNNIKDNLLTEAHSSFGIKEKNEYGFINNLGIESGLYITGANATYPYINIVESLPVLASTETYLDDEVINESEYQYTNAVVHRQGLGFCGFEKIKITDSLNGTIIREYEPFKFGMQKSETTRGAKIDFTNRVEISANKTYKLLVERKREENLLTGSIIKTSCSYNNYGYPCYEFTETTDNLDIETSREYVNYEDIDNPETGYIIGLVSMQATTKTRNGIDWYTEKEIIPSYSRGLPLSKETFKNGNQTRLETYSYDSRGIIIEETITPYNSDNTHKSTYSYDTYGRLLKETDPAGHTKQYAYNPQGLIDKSTDIRGNITTYEYDTFGRQKKINNPDGTQQTLEYTWETTDNGRIYSITETTTGSPTVKKYYDALNREVRKEETRFDGSTIKTDKQYDNKGNLISESLPYKTGPPSLWVDYTYDSNNRLTSRQEPTGKQTNYSYANNFVIEDDGIKQTVKEYNTAGELLSVSDPEGIIYFELGADGQKQNVLICHETESAEINTSYQYDDYRRVISINDPSHGETTTTYDKDGNIATQTDANGATISYEYDSYGRLIKKTFPGFSTTYTYNEYNELISQKSTNQTYKTFDYDTYGRLISETEGGTRGAWLRKDYTYSEGNISTITYTSNYGKLTTENYTYTNGHLTEVKISGGQTIYKLQQENEFGKPTQALTGGITRYYTYDEYGFPTSRSAETEDKIYQDESYEFDTHRSNLATRSDYIYDEYKYFDYDNQDRLINDNGIYIDYDLNGNIIEKSGIGTYQYNNNTKPYAVTDIIPYSEPAGSLKREQDIEYASFSRPTKITENGYTAKFEYNADGDRVEMAIAGNILYDRLERTYLGGCYECDDNGLATDNFFEKLYLMGDYYSAPSVLLSGEIISQERFDTIPSIKGDSLIWGEVPAEPIDPIRPLGLEPGVITIPGYFTHTKAHVGGVHQILRDYLGSITHIIKPDGTEAETLSYDA
ncbi:MAG: FG-GAP-like repeat-containing protein, partial [Muribaculaceae bacterium]|nr:FG-GAP-like repeat-containing protein [Muribaculaceae bacterium]